MPIKTNVAVLGAFILLTTLMTYPLVFHLHDRVPGWPGDNLYYVWQIWWFKRALIDLKIPPYFNPYAYYPVGFDLARGEMTPSNTVLAIPFTLLLGPIAAYNLLLLSSFVLSGFGTYLWISYITQNRWGGFLAGAIFAFSPYRMGHFPGHLELMTTQWLPFCLFYLEKLIQKRRILFAVASGLFFGLNVWGSWYYFYFASLLLPLYLVVRLRGQSIRTPFFKKSFIIFATVALLMLVPIAPPYLHLRDKGEMHRSFLELDAWSANPTDFFVPNLLHPLWGKRLRALVPFQWKVWVEKNLYIGLITSSLAALSFCRLRAKKTVQALAVVALASFLFALGPTLHWAGRRVHIPVRGGVMAVLYYLGVTPYLTPRLDPSLLHDMQVHRYIFIPLPSLLLYLFMPLTSSMRILARFGMVTILALAGLAGYGVKVLSQGIGRRFSFLRCHSWILPIALIGLSLFEFLALSYQMTPICPRLVDIWLFNQPDSGAIVEFPLTESTHPMQSYYATVHRKPTIFGPIGTSFQPPELYNRLEALRAFPIAGSIQALRDWGTSYVLVHSNLYEDWTSMVEKLEETNALSLIGHFNDIYVYKLVK